MKTPLRLYKIWKIKQVIYNWKILLTYLTDEEENKVPKMKQKPEKWHHDYFQCILVTEILLH